LATPVTMPQLGETVIEGTITKWLKKEGDTVERDEPLFEISTDKVDTEVPSPLAGMLTEIKVQEGETVGVGTELAMIDTEGDGQAAAPPAERAEAPKAEDQPEEAEQRPRTSGGDGDGQMAPVRQASAVPAAGPRSQILSPLVRRLAEEHRIDLAQVRGTGTGGRITKRDVLAFAEEGGAAMEPAAEAPARQAEGAPAAAGQDREEAIPLTRMRQAIARNMVASIQTTARAWNLVEVNMESVARVRAEAKHAFKEREGIALTYMPFVAKAVCDALLAFPDVNSELRDDQMIVKHYVNLGIAVALDEGLIVPVVKGADEMNVVGLARAINDVATRARGKKLNPDDVHGGTFTITNPGPFGSIMSVPVINPPQCAILAFDAVEKRPVVIDDAIAIRHMVYLSMSWDHRIIDGATAAKFLGRLKQNLETWDFGPEVGLPART
jgi:2-oxoglutarate dehydrogenase dihydrolipoamide succinyltransferase (E2 component)